MNANPIKIHSEDISLSTKGETDIIDLTAEAENGARRANGRSLCK